MNEHLSPSNAYLDGGDVGTRTPDPHTASPAKPRMQYLLYAQKRYIPFLVSISYHPVGCRNGCRVSSPPRVPVVLDSAPNELIRGFCCSNLTGVQELGQHP